MEDGQGKDRRCVSGRDTEIVVRTEVVNKGCNSSWSALLPANSLHAILVVHVRRFPKLCNCQSTNFLLTI